MHFHCSCLPGKLSSALEECYTPVAIFTKNIFVSWSARFVLKDYEKTTFYTRLHSFDLTHYCDFPFLCWQPHITL